MERRSSGLIWIKECPFGVKGEILSPSNVFRFGPNNRHRSIGSACPFGGKLGHLWAWKPTYCSTAHALWTSQLFKSQLGNLRRVLDPKPANRDDLLGDKLRDGVVAIFETQRPQSLFVSRH